MKKFLAFRIICAFIVISVLAPLLLSCSLKADNSQTDNQPSENKEPSQNNAPPDVDNDSDKGGNSTGDDNSGDNTGADTENGNPNDNSEPEKEPPDKPLTTSEILQTLLNGEYNRDDVNLTSNKNSELEVSFYDEMAFGQNGFSLLNFNNNSKILKNNCFFEEFFLRSIINIHQNNSENLSYVTLISNVLELYPNFENSYISESQFPENAILLDIMSPHLSKLTAQNISYEIKIPIYYGCKSGTVYGGDGKVLESNFFFSIGAILCSEEAYIYTPESENTFTRIDLSEFDQDIHGEYYLSSIASVTIVPPEVYKSLYDAFYDYLLFLTDTQNTPSDIIFDMENYTNNEGKSEYGIFIGLLENLALSSPDSSNSIGFILNSVSNFQNIFENISRKSDKLYLYLKIMSEFDPEYSDMIMGYYTMLQDYILSKTNSDKSNFMTAEIVCAYACSDELMDMYIQYTILSLILGTENTDYNDVFGLISDGSDYNQIINDFFAQKSTDDIFILREALISAEYDERYTVKLKLAFELDIQLPFMTASGIFETEFTLLI